jgi:predicted ATPase
MPGYILTGAPGVGKTAILRLLEVNGHVVVDEAATDAIALDKALGHEEPWHEHAFIDKVVALQLQRQNSMFFLDRSPVCTLALSHYLGFAPSRLLTEEVDRVVAEGVYETTVFFIRKQGFVQTTAARRISFKDVFEQLHEQTYRDFGFLLVEVPAGPLTERATLIEQTVERLRR